MTSGDVVQSPITNPQSSISPLRAFLLPLFTLAYASGAIGTEREGRTLVWLLTRPVPRPAVYLAELLGTLPWCLLFGLGGFFVLCRAGGDPGREALRLYWPAAAA